jgi:hypothetical protein
VQPDSSESWRLSTTHANPTLHAALFVRDAFHLKPEDEAAIPPRLSGDVPNLSSLALSVDAVDASHEWATWWEKVIRYEGSVARGAYADDVRDGNLRAMSVARADVFDPPYFSSMDKSPALQSLARTSHREALRWSKFHSTPVEVPEPVVNSVVWEMCSFLHVNPARLDASIIVLDVEGVWSYLPEPGLLLLSQGALRKESVLEDRLREAFLEQLGTREKSLVRLRETATDLYRFLDRV